jgi:hypothetical protein
MGRRPITTFTLSKERAKQLKMIADERYLSTAQLFASFINSEIRKGTILDEIPGYRIKRIRRHVEIGINSSTLMATAEEASQLSKILDQVASDPFWWGRSQLSNKQTYGSSYGRDFITLETGDHVLIRRRGRGLVIEVNKYDKRRTSAQRSLSPDVASDLARLIRAAAKKATRR